MKWPNSDRRRRPTKKSWQAAFSIMEVMVSLVALSAGLGAVMKLTQDQSRTIAYYEALMEIDSIFEEIRYAMANEDVCTTTLKGVSVSSGSVSAIKSKAGAELFKTTGSYGALKTIKLASISTGTPTGAHGSNEYALNFSFTVPRGAHSSGTFQIKRSLTFRAQVSSGNVVACQSASTDDRHSEIWDNAEGSHLLSFLSLEAGSGIGRVGLGMSGATEPLSLASGVDSEYSMEAPGGMIIGIPTADDQLSNVAYVRAAQKELATQVDSKIQEFCTNHVYDYMKDGVRVTEAFNPYDTEGIRSCATPMGADFTPAFPATIAPTAEPSCPASFSAGEFVENKNCCHKCGSGCIQEYRFSLYHYYCSGGSNCQDSVPGMYCPGKSMTMTISGIPADSFCVHQTNFYEKSRLCKSRSAYCIRTGSTATIVCDSLIPTAAPQPTSNICGTLANGQYVTNTTRCCKLCPGQSCTSESFTNRYGSKFSASYCSSKPSSCAAGVVGNACNNSEVLTFTAASEAACKLVCLNPDLHGEGQALCHSRKVTCSCEGAVVKLKCTNT